MKAKTVRYERLANLGNFENEKIGIDVEIEPGETAADVLAAARRFVTRYLTNRDRDMELRHAREVLAHAQYALPEEIAAAEGLLAQTPDEDELPF